ncbi:hyalin-like [Amphiura filiformis]|uniref:hyalin-like n=1 Tax=Amphiura filiformis TaxID=82378 RepID=UPI003B2249C9
MQPQTCMGCPTADQGPTDGCQRVTWTPPTSANALDGMTNIYSDCLHFPDTTFPPGETTTVTYTFQKNGFKNYCKFEVTVPNNCNPLVSGCPNENILVDAGSSADGAIVTYGPITSPTAGAKVENVTGDPSGSKSLVDITGYHTRSQQTPTNPGAHSTFTYQMGDIPLETVSTHKHLGVVLSSNLEWGPHVDTITSKAQRLLGFIQRTVGFNDPDTLKKLFFALVRPILEYCAPVWAPNREGDSEPVGAVCTLTDIVAILNPPDNTASVEDQLKPQVDSVFDEAGVITSSTMSHTLNHPFPLGTTPFVLTLIDNGGNSHSCLTTITVQMDEQDPYITNCNNYTEYTTETSGTILVNYPEPDITDNCDEFQVTVTPTRDTRFQVESIQRITYVVEDNAGNTAECSFTVEVRIDQYPTFDNCPESFTAYTDTGTTSTEVTWEAPQARDDNQFNVNNVELTVSPSLLVSLDPYEDQELTLERGVYTVTYSYTDVALQERLCTFTITVQG